MGVTRRALLESAAMEPNAAVGGVVSGMATLNDAKVPGATKFPSTSEICDDTVEIE